jgi:PAS domain S-box-containing protein
VIEFFTILKIATCLLSVVLATAIISRDPGLRINRLMALVPLLTAQWSFCEILWIQQNDAESAAMLIRLTSTAWMFFGPVCLHIFYELSGRDKPIMRFLLPVSYLVSTTSALIYNLTDLGMTKAVPGPWGWTFEFGPLFPLLYGMAIAPLSYVLACWGRVLPHAGSQGERMVWLSIYGAVSGALAVATLTDAILPLMGIPFPSLGSTCIVLVAMGLAYQFHRYGYSLLAPAAFATEILQTLDDGVVLLRSNGRIRIANDAFLSLVGLSRASVLGTSITDFLPDMTLATESLGEPIEADLFTSDGEQIRVLITRARLRPIHDDGLSSAFVIRDLREVLALRDNLVTSERLATVGELSGSIAEEIREPIYEARSHLEAMQGQSTCLADLIRGCPSAMELSELAADREELLEECLEGVDRIAAIARDVRGFATGGLGQREAFALDQIVKEAARIAIPGRGTEIDLQMDLGEVAAVLCAKDEIVQVLVNLLVNAFQATGDGGEVRITSKQQGARVLLQVNDDGPGIPSDVIERIFDPFFTTKPIGEGTGLGLSISHHILRHHGGDLFVESDFGNGSRFTVVLPVA